MFLMGLPGYNTLAEPGDTIGASALALDSADQDADLAQLIRSRF
jgi:hypothetical protein